MHLQLETIQTDGKLNFNIKHESQTYQA